VAISPEKLTLVYSISFISTCCLLMMGVIFGVVHTDISCASAALLLLGYLQCVSMLSAILPLPCGKMAE